MRKPNNKIVNIQNNFLLLFRFQIPMRLDSSKTICKPKDNFCLEIGEKKSRETTQNFTAFFSRLAICGYFVRICFITIAASNDSFII